MDVLAVLLITCWRLVFLMRTRRHRATGRHSSRRSRVTVGPASAPDLSAYTVLVTGLPGGEAGAVQHDLTQCALIVCIR
jgi:hypothetical protein